MTRSGVQIPPGPQKYINNLIMYKCKYCDKEFEKRYSMIGHIALCKKNPNYEINKKNCNNLSNVHKKGEKPPLTGQTKNCQYCGKEYKVYGLKNHEKYCEYNPNKIEYPTFKHIGHIAWNKGLTVKNDIRIQQATEKVKQYYETHDGTWKGRKHSDEEKDKIRIAQTEHIKSIIDWGSARISKTACKYMDKLNEEKHWNLQHGMNGGEITCIGYFLDGYDKDLNIVFEYDEPRHYVDVTNNILCEKDIIRQNKIINELHCEFWRYNEKMDLLYKVN